MHTGINERRAGDELLGLIRSVIYAGLPSLVMASLWPVDQLSSAMVILEFDCRLLAGSRNADALQLSQLWLRRATAQDALHVPVYSRARGRPGDSRRAEVAVSLARAQVLLFAYDLPAAIEALEQILTQPDLITAESQAATQARDLAVACRPGTAPSRYSRRPSASGIQPLAVDQRFVVGAGL